MQNRALIKIGVSLCIVIFGLAVVFMYVFRKPLPGPARAPLPGVPVSITPEQAEKIKAAYQTAMQDPKVAAAQSAAKDAWDAFRVLVRKKVLADDPAIKPLLDKADRDADAAMAGRPAEEPLSAEDNKALNDAFQKVETDSEVKEAQTKFNEARNTKDMLIHAAIVRADPSLSSILNAIDSDGK